MKARLVKFDEMLWMWEFYSGNGQIVCDSVRVFESKKAALKSLLNFCRKLESIASLYYLEIREPPTLNISELGKDE